MIATRHPPRHRPAEAPPETAVRALVRTFGLLERVQQPYWSKFGISGSQWGVLRALHRAELERPGGLRLTDLSQRLLVRPPSVTGVIDRLQRVGLVLRGASSGDLRTKPVSLTPRGKVNAGGARALHLLLQGVAKDCDAGRLIVNGKDFIGRRRIPAIFRQIAQHVRRDTADEADQVVVPAKNRPRQHQHRSLQLL